MRVCLGSPRAQLKFAIQGPGQIRSNQEHKQYHWPQRFYAVPRQIMRDHRAYPGEGESGVGPFLELEESRNQERDRAQRFGDSENDAQLLRVSNMRKSIDGLRAC